MCFDLTAVIHFVSCLEECCRNEAVCNIIIIIVMMMIIPLLTGFIRHQSRIQQTDGEHSKGSVSTERERETAKEY